MFKVYLVTALVFAIAWIIAWFAFVRPYLKHYAATSRMVDRIEAAEGSALKKVGIWAEGKWLVLVGFLDSAFAAGKAAVDQAAFVTTQAVSTVAGASPDQLAPLQDKGLWSAFFTDIRTMQIMAAMNILMVFLHLRAIAKAATIVPAPGTAAPVPAPAAPSP